MIVASLILGVAAVVVALVQVWRSERRRADRLLDARVRRDILVTLNTGPSFTGVLLDSDARTLVMVNAVAENGTPVDGELLIRWDDVAFVQLP